MFGNEKYAFKCVSNTGNCCSFEFIFKLTPCLIWLEQKEIDKSHFGTRNVVNVEPRLRSQTESRYVPTVPDGKCLCPDRPRRKVPMSRLSCVHQTFVRSCPDFRAFTRLSCVHVQTFVRSPDFRAFMSRLSCVHVQIFVRSPDYSCVHDQTFVRSPDYSCVHVQTFVRFSLFPDHVNLNARHPRRAFIWVWTYRLSVWELNLGS